jgi:hypothetical protein
VQEKLTEAGRGLPSRDKGLQRGCRDQTWEYSEAAERPGSFHMQRQPLGRFKNGARRSGDLIYWLLKTTPAQGKSRNCYTHKEPKETGPLNVLTFWNTRIRSKLRKSL